MQGTARSQIYQLSWVRAVAALLVVCYHCELTLAKPKYFGHDVLPFFHGGFSGVELFFVLSGFVIFLAHHRDKEGNPSIIRNFALKRIRRIIPTLWVVLVPLTILSLDGVASAHPSGWNVFASFFMLPVEKEVILGTEWTLRHELLFYVLFAVFLWNRLIGTIIFVLWGVLGSVLALAFDAHWLVEFLLNPNHLLFLFGMLIAVAYMRGRMIAGPVVFASGCVMFALFYGFSLANAMSFDLLSLGFGLGAVGIIYGLCAMPYLNKKVGFLDEAGNASYALYLIHYPLISFSAKIVLEIQRRLPLPPAVYFIFTVIGCQIAAILFYRFVEKPLLAWVSSRTSTRRVESAVS